MLNLTPIPLLPTKADPGPFTQSVVLADDTRPIGKALWCSINPCDGVVQLLDLSIDPACRRAGHGRRLLSAVIEQVRAYHRLHKQNFRRLWIGVGHKQQVIGRSFLTREGFHHIGSACGILNDQDLLIYVKSFD
jgi:GNAT superfamily N-acetyltransferase